jgi:hypothetical protein
VPPARLPFGEVKFFDKVASVQRHLMAFPRGVIKTALEDPIVYLEVILLHAGKSLGQTLALIIVFSGRES